MKKLFRLICVTTLLATVSFGEKAPSLRAFPVSAQSVAVQKNGAGYLTFNMGGWGGPGWKGFMSFKGNMVSSQKGFQLKSTSKAQGTPLSVEVDVKKTQSDQMQLQCDLQSSKETGIHLIILGLTLDSTLFEGGTIRVETAEGKTSTVYLPLGKGGLGDQVKTCTLVDRDGLETTLTFEPACSIQSDTQLRIVLAEEKLDQSATQLITIDLPENLHLYTAINDVPFEKGFDDWFAFAAGCDASKPSEIGMQDWLEKPAGKHGRIIRKDDDLFYNGKPIKLWGINNCYAACSPEKGIAKKRAVFYSKYGINSVRLHKYADGAGWAGIQSAQSFVEFDPAGLNRMDYLVAQHKENGIYTKLSSTFGVKLGAADSDRVPYIEEFGKLPSGNKRLKTGHGSVFLSRELQEMQIEQVVNLLEHKNKYTKMTYAEDPSIAVIELFNEDCILFFGTQSILQKIPTLRKRTAEAFSNWLHERYKTEEAFLAAWGPKALNSFASEGFDNESWEEKTIVPAGNPWFFDPDQLDGSQAHKKARLLDTMLFLYELQNDFYDRYVQAIRETGYEGEILASNWQAGRGFSHYYNLHSDRRIGLIDRHNYFGGGNQTINNASMLRSAGSGMLSAGMQQVSDRPFMLSEWIHVAPTEWGVEGVALIGAYGMGLQGWDVSYIFQNKDNGTFDPKIPSKGWKVTVPQIIGIFPAVSRHILRGDIQQSDVIAPRYVHFPSLHKGKIGFNDQVTQTHDVKTFTSDKVPDRTLAVARCVVDFTDEYRDTPTFDLTPYTEGATLKSSTEQLRWQEGANKMDGFFTINTPATKAVVGFSGGQAHELGNVTITPESRFSAIYLTAKEPDENLDTSDNLLVVAIARARNTGMNVLADRLVLTPGTAPIVMEPVRATISLKRKGAKKVILLDHDGCLTEKTIPIRNGTFEIDGAVDKTCYYLVRFK